MQTIAISRDVTLSQEVRLFCERRGILGHLQLALRLAGQTFVFDRDPVVAVETDPETDEESVVIDIWSALSVDEAVERKLNYTRKWVQSIPPDVIGTIRLILNIV